MNKKFYIIFLLSLSSFALATEPSAPLKDILRLQGVSKQEIMLLRDAQKKTIEKLAILQITSLLPKEDVADMRLVCKEWASKNKNWNNKQFWAFMPADVEKEHDNIMKRKCKITAFDQAIILFHFTIKNNFDAVKWIRYNTNTWQGMKCGEKWTIFPFMIAIHNKKPEIARFLIEIDQYYKDNNWKFYYNTITMPKTLQDYLYPHDNRNFSFLFYYIAVLTDNAHDLEKLYSQKIPTYDGQNFLIAVAKSNNAIECLKILSETREAKEILQKKCHKRNMITIMVVIQTRFVLYYNYPPYNFYNIC